MKNQWGCDYVHQIAPYVAGKPIAELAREQGLQETEIVKLASNENPLGRSALVQPAIAQALSELSRYPDANAHVLKQALSAHYDVPQTWLTLGNGSNDVLDIATRVFVSVKDKTVFSQYAFLVYGLATKAVGARAIQVQADGLAHDLEAMLMAIDAQTRMVFIANPNNPTGTFIEATRLKHFIERVPQHVIVALDEAYIEYLPQVCQYDALQWVCEFPNLIVFRTFSKAYGLAGLRVGFAVAQPHLTDLLNRVRQPFNVNGLAQAAAIAALKDQDFIAKTAQLNEHEYHYLIAELERLNVQYMHSFGNFVLVKLSETAAQTAAIHLELLKQGVIVRPVANYGLPEWVRISIGLRQENEKLIRALQTIFSELLVE